MKKVLLYTTAFNNPVYMRLVKEMIISLRNVGFDSDIFVITNMKFSILSGLDKVYVKYVPHKYFSMAQYSPSLFHNFKEYLDYEHIIYSDSDILYKRNPMFMLDYIDGFDIALSVEDEVKLIDNSYNLKYFLDATKANLSGEEKSINIGSFVIDPKRAMHVCEQFEREWELLSNKESDLGQSIFQHMLVTNNTVKHNYIDPLKYLYPLHKPYTRQYNEEICMIHLFGLFSKEFKLNCMKDFNRNFEEWKAKYCDSKEFFKESFA